MLPCLDPRRSAGSSPSRTSHQRVSTAVHAFRQQSVIIEIRPKLFIPCMVTFRTELVRPKSPLHGRRRDAAGCSRAGVTEDRSTRATHGEGQAKSCRVAERVEIGGRGLVMAGPPERADGLATARSSSIRRWRLMYLSGRALPERITCVARPGMDVVAPRLAGIGDTGAAHQSSAGVQENISGMWIEAAPPALCGPAALVEWGIVLADRLTIERDRLLRRQVRQNSCAARRARSRPSSCAGWRPSRSRFRLLRLRHL